MNHFFFARVLCYPLVLFAVMSYCDRYYGDTYAANVTFFGLFVIVFEVLCRRPPRSMPIWRILAYKACVLATVCGGVALAGASLRFSMGEHRATHGRVMSIVIKDGKIVRICRDITRATGFTEAELVGTDVCCLLSGVPTRSFEHTTMRTAGGKDIDVLVCRAKGVVVIVH